KATVGAEHNAQTGNSTTPTPGPPELKLLPNEGVATLESAVVSAASSKLQLRSKYGWKDFNHLPDPSRINFATSQKLVLQPLEDALQYNFEDKSWLLQACTCESVDMPAEGSLNSIQFVGSAVFNALTTIHVFGTLKQ